MRAHSLELADAGGPAAGRRIRWVAAVISVAAALLGTILYRTGAGRSVSIDDPTISLPMSLAFSVAGAVMLEFPQARAVGRMMLGCGLLASLAILSLGLGSQLAASTWSYTPVFEYFGGVGSLSAAGLALVVLPQLFPDGPLPGLGRVMAWISAVLVVGTILNLLLVNVLSSDDTEWPWTLMTGVVAVGALLGLFTLVVRWRRAASVVRRQISSVLIGRLFGD